MMTKADLPFTTQIRGYYVHFETDDFGSVIATCDQLPDLRIRAPVVEHAIMQVSIEVQALAADKSTEQH